MATDLKKKLILELLTQVSSEQKNFNTDATLWGLKKDLIKEEAIRLLRTSSLTDLLEGNISRSETGLLSKGQNQEFFHERTKQV